MASFEDLFKLTCETFKIQELTPLQKEAIEVFINEKRDVFINLPTGYGKSLIYQAIPLLFDQLHESNKNHIVVVVSPLINLMVDQVTRLRSLGISAISLSDISDEEAKDLEKGLFSVVYGTPESWLKNQRWRSMLSSDIYKTKVCAIAVDEAHVIKEWGTSKNVNMAAFRETYYELHELRSLVKANIVALTATATMATTKTIMEVLLMKNPHVIRESPNRSNIAYAVHYMEDKTIEEYFSWLVKEIVTKKQDTPRTIIYCQTIKQCSILYATLRALLRDDLYTSEEKNRRNVVLEMLHSCTPKSNKDTILIEFQKENSNLRVLIATIAFGMGMDCKEVGRIIHFGPAKTAEAYVQETGRAGRDGKQSVAFLLYKGLLLNHVEKDIKEFISTSSCRRKTLLQNFEENSLQSLEPLHLCCDNCAKICQCGSTDCGELTLFRHGMSNDNQSSVPPRTRMITDEKMDQLKENLNQYHKTLLEKLKFHSKNMQLKSVSNPHFLLGFSDVQIIQVCDNCKVLFSLNDVFNHVEIWDIKHAHQILKILNEVFEDVNEIGDAVMDDILDDDILQLEEWNDIVEDTSLIELAMSNLWDDSDSDVMESTCADVPDSVLNLLENLSF